VFFVGFFGGWSVWAVLFKGTVSTVPYGCFVVSWVLFGGRAGARPALTITLN